MKTSARIFGVIAISFLLYYATEGNLFAQMSEGGSEMKITSTAFEEGETIPRKYTCAGEDVSPALTWSESPKGTKSFVLICDDPDAPVGTWVHWVLYGISPNVTTLDENVPPDGEVLDGARQGRNDFGNLGYGGPCPPPGRAHRYYFKLYALDIKPELAVGATKAEVLKAIEGHVLSEAQLMGRFARK